MDWASAFNAESWEEVNRIDNDGVKEAKKAMERIMSDSYRRQLLWDRKMAEMDYRSQMSAAERKGIAIGEARGETRGWNKATKEAEERDRKRVRNMYAEGDSVEKIARSMEIDADQIRKWIQ